MASPNRGRRRFVGKLPPPFPRSPSSRSPSSSRLRSTSPRSARRSTSPRSPQPRRRSFSAHDVFHSPVEWSKSPRHALDADEMQRILDKGDLMCRNKINPAYIRDVVTDPNVSLWMVRDARGRIFGFAATRRHRTHLQLELICAHRRTNRSDAQRGDGIGLFGDILQYALGVGLEVRLDAVNGKVAQGYAREAHRRGFEVFRTRSEAPIAPAQLGNLQKVAGEIPMRFVPPGARSPQKKASSLLMSAAEARLAKRLMFDVSSDSSDGE